MSHKLISAVLCCASFATVAVAEEAAPAEEAGRRCPENFHASGDRSSDHPASRRDRFSPASSRKLPCCLCLGLFNLWGATVAISACGAHGPVAKGPGQRLSSFWGRAPAG